MIKDSTPLLHYFESGNIFSGSDGGKRYKITPDKEGGMTCRVWMGENCLEATDPGLVAEKKFPITLEGRDEMIAWIEAFDGTIV